MPQVCDLWLSHFRTAQALLDLLARICNPCLYYFAMANYTFYPFY